MRRLATWPLVLFVLAGFQLSPAASEAGAELLTNPGFELWGATGPTGWQGNATKDDGESGFGAVLSAAGGATELMQLVEGIPGLEYDAEVRAKQRTGTVEVILQIDFLSDSLALVGRNVVQEPASPFEFQALSLAQTAPGGTAFVRFRVAIESLDPQGEAVIDSASLRVTGAAMTPTATATPTRFPSVEPSTPRPSQTPGRTSTPTPTRTPTAIPTPTPTRTPQTVTPAPSPEPDGEWGLLANGGFEMIANGQPIGWAKNGGTLGIDANAAAGDWAATLHSATSSTKWIHQAVPVNGGDWYRVLADARVATGNGAVFVRVSWYASRDGSGSMIGYDDSSLTQARQWTRLTGGPLQAPEAANSARVRLMLRPDSSADVVAAFDNVVFEPAEPPPDPVRLTYLAADGVIAGERRVVAIPVVAAAARAQAATPGLRISEFASDPAEPGRDTAYEWVELVNTGSEPVDLAGWLIGDANELDELPAHVVPPGGFVVIAASEATFSAEVPVVRVPDGDIGRGLNNSGDVIRLVAPGGMEADAVSYGDNASMNSPAPSAPDAGQTLARDESGAWRLTIRATPGKPNEFAPIATRTANAVPRPGSVDAPPASERGDETQPQGRVQVVESADGGSPVPWILLGAAGGAGAVASALGASKLLAQRRRR